MAIRDSDVVLEPRTFDSEPDIFALERKIRPNRPGIIQLQMDELDLYTVFIYPDKMHEFNDPDQLERFLIKTIAKDWIRPTVDESFFVRRSMAMMSNYKLVNIDLKEGRCDIVRGYNKLTQG